MDEKKVRETIAWLETKREIHKRGAYKSPIIPKEQIDMIEEYYNLAIKALEKQLPKKPIEKGIHFVYYKCPNCNRILPIGKNYCDCGQRLDWPEE